MITTIIFDTDGMVVTRELVFSQRFSREFNVPMEKILPFFQNEFQRCLVGQADLKEELEKYRHQWQWSGSIDELLDYWFKHENTINQPMVERVKELRQNGIECYLSTNNEKYRVQYLMETLDLQRWFTGIFSSADLGYKKPEIEYWQAIHDRLHQPDKQAIFVWDDDQENVDSAITFGFLSELYTDTGSFDRRMKSLTRR